MLGYLKKGIQPPMAQGRSSKFNSMIKWIRTSWLSIKNSLFAISQKLCPSIPHKVDSMDPRADLQWEEGVVFLN